MKHRLLCLLLALVLLLSACAESGNDRRKKDKNDRGEREPAAAMQVQTILFQTEYDEGTEYATITALDEDGQTVWMRQTQQYPVAQLTNVTEIGMWEDRFYYVENGQIVALNRETGETLWENNEFQGAPAGKNACLIMEDGTIVATGYFGPDLAVVSKDGALVHYLDTYDTNIFWPYDVVMEDGMIVITFEGSPYDTGETKLKVDPKTWEVSE